LDLRLWLLFFFSVRFQRRCKRAQLANEGGFGRCACNRKTRNFARTSRGHDGMTYSKAASVCGCVFVLSRGRRGGLLSFWGVYRIQTKGYSLSAPFFCVFCCEQCVNCSLTPKWAGEGQVCVYPAEGHGTGRTYRGDACVLVSQVLGCEWARCEEPAHGT
jgi:hypothetical protein